jgi:hypothetical protein
MPSYSATKAHMDELRVRIFPQYNEIFMPEVSELKRHIYDVGTIIVREKGKFFHELLSDAYNSGIPLRSNLPLITKSKGKYFIHKNLVFRATFSIVNHVRLSPSVGEDYQDYIFDNLHTKAMQFAKIPAKAAQWADLGSITKTLRKKQEISVYDYYMQYAYPDNTKLHKNDIVKFANKLSDLYAPTELQIAETYDEMTHMYENGPSSCMKSSGGDRTWTGIFAEEGVHPVHFYVDCPYIVGAYVKKGGYVYARTLLYKNDDDKIAYMGRIYSGDKKYTNALISQVEERYGKLRSLGDEEYIFPYAWEIKLREYKKKKYFPIPYTDNIYLDRSNGCMTFAWNKEKDTVLVSNKPKYTVPDEYKKHIFQMDTRNQCGYIWAHQFRDFAPCKSCGKVVDTRHCGKFMYDDAMYCSLECAFKDGFLQVRDSASHVTLQHKDTEGLFIDEYFNKNYNVKPEQLWAGRFYSNREAAIRNGARPVITLEQANNLTKELVSKLYDGPLTTYASYYVAIPGLRDDRRNRSKNGYAQIEGITGGDMFQRKDPKLFARCKYHDESDAYLLPLKEDTANGQESKTDE